jgi:outer membrane protein assembly factor BamB
MEGKMEVQDRIPNSFVAVRNRGHGLFRQHGWHLLCSRREIRGRNVEIQNEGIRSSSVMQNHTVYFGDDGGQFYALDAGTGHEKWRIRTAGAIISSAGIADGIVYFGNAGGYRYAIDLDTGKRKWRFRAPLSWMRSSPAIAKGMIYFGSDDGNLYALR